MPYNIIYYATVIAQMNPFDFFRGTITSPIPTIIVAICGTAISNYFGIPVYKFGLGYTGVAVALGLGASLIGGTIGSIITRKNDSAWIVKGMLFIGPPLIAAYKIGTFWLTLFAVQGIKSFVSAISQ